MARVPTRKDIQVEIDKIRAEVLDGAEAVDAEELINSQVRLNTMQFLQSQQ